MVVKLWSHKNIGTLSLPEMCFLIRCIWTIPETEVQSQATHSSLQTSEISNCNSVKSQMSIGIYHANHVSLYVCTWLCMCKLSILQNCSHLKRFWENVLVLSISFHWKQAAQLEKLRLYYCSYNDINAGYRNDPCHKVWSLLRWTNVTEWN